MFIYPPSRIFLRKSAPHYIITLDFELLWNHHINSLIARISPSLNLLRCSSSSQWLGEFFILIILYKLIIHSKLDYGSILYGPTSKNHSEKLEHLENKCIRLIIKVFSSNPTAILYAETKISPLSVKRDYLTKTSPPILFYILYHTKNTISINQR